MFIDNKYTALYYRIVDKVNSKNRLKVTGDSLQFHHIIPRSLGGTDDEKNLILCSLQEHRVCHKLLVKMTVGCDHYKMAYALRLFGISRPCPSPHHTGSYTTESAKKSVATRRRRGSYKTGKENNFAKPEIKEMVRKRMLANNPMKSSKQRNRMKSNNNNPKNVPITIMDINFPSINAAARYFNTTAHLLKRDYVITRLTSAS